MKIKNLTHGILVLNPKLEKDGKIPVVHFLGLWKEPNENDFENLKDELRNDSQYELNDVVDDLEFILADEETIEFYNELVKNDEVDFIIHRNDENGLLDNITLN